MLFQRNKGVRNVRDTPKRNGVKIDPTGEETKGLKSSKTQPIKFKVVSLPYKLGR